MLKWWLGHLSLVCIYTFVNQNINDIGRLFLLLGLYIWEFFDWILFTSIATVVLLAFNASRSQNDQTNQRTSIATTKHEKHHRMNSDLTFDGNATSIGGEKVEVIRDVLYEYIRISWLAKEFIDKTEFQELRDLRQLGMAHSVFPSCNHTRFEHSIGVYHLARWMVSSLLERQPELWSTVPSNLRSRFVELVALAGLLHDVGHYAGSHCFDEEVAPKIGLPNHEERGVLLIRKMVQKYEIPLEKHEVEFICGLILGSNTLKPSWIRGIVHNKESEVDLDKFDYIMRDSYYLNLGKPIQVARLIQNARVLDVMKNKKDEKEKEICISPMAPGGPDVKNDINMDHGHDGLRICYNEKVFLQICDVFQSRYRLFREVYRHRVILGVDEMMGELMRGLTPVFRIWLANNTRPTDASIASIKNWLPFVPDDVLDPKTKTELLAIWEKLRSRRLYKVVQVNDESTADIHVRLGLSALADDPVEKVWFFNKKGLVNHIKIQEVTKLLGSSPRTASETLHYQLIKSTYIPSSPVLNPSSYTTHFHSLPVLDASLYDD